MELASTYLTAETGGSRLAFALGRVAAVCLIPELSRLPDQPQAWDGFFR